MSYILGFLLESNTQIWHFFLGYFIGILISDYCKSPQKSFFWHSQFLTSPGKATLPCCLHQETTIY
jgi:hypothetical protein